MLTSDPSLEFSSACQFLLRPGSCCWPRTSPTSCSTLPWSSRASLTRRRRPWRWQCRARCQNYKQIYTKPKTNWNVKKGSFFAASSKMIRSQVTDHKFSLYVFKNNSYSAFMNFRNYLCHDKLLTSTVVE